MTFHDQLLLLRRSREMNRTWYLETYKDVAALKVDPAEHYLRLGAALDRDPGPHFDTRFYKQAHASELSGGLNPLVHYLTTGRDRQLPCQPPKPPRVTPSRPSPKIARLSDALLSLGFRDRARADLEAACDAGSPLERAAAAHVLALQAYRQRQAPEAQAALDRLDAAPREGVPLALRRRMAVLELLAAGAARPETVERRFAEARRAGLIGPDLMLAFAGLQDDPQTRLFWINRVLAQHALAPVTLRSEAGPSLYDRLDVAPDAPMSEAPVSDGPLVTVLVAAYEAERSLPATLRSLCAQSWRNLEILVIDDASTDGTAEAAREAARHDPRIRLLRQEVNGGAYAARNRGLSEARGDYVTLQDADDWSHPARIARQVAALEADADLIGCLSDQARMTEDLRFPRLAGNGGIIGLNVSSLMFRRAPVTEDLGGWDPVRVEADSEWIARLRARYGRAAIRKLDSGPLGFQRIGAASAIADPVTGFDGYYFGARKFYREAQMAWHAREALHWNGQGPRPFAAPSLLKWKHPVPIEADLAIAADWRAEVPGIAPQALEALGADGRRVALVHLYRYGLDRPAICPPPEAIADLLASGRLRMAVKGETLRCGRLVLPDAEAMAEMQVHLPQIDTDAALITDPAAPQEAETQACRLFGLPRDRLSRAPLDIALAPTLATGLPQADR